MTLRDFISSASDHTPFYIKYGRFDKERNKHMFIEELFESKTKIPTKLYSRTVTHVDVQLTDTYHPVDGILIEL